MYILLPHHWFSNIFIKDTLLKWYTIRNCNFKTGKVVFLLGHIYFYNFKMKIFTYEVNKQWDNSDIRTHLNQMLWTTVSDS